MKRFSYLVMLCLLPALIFSSCDEDADPVMGQKPTVRVTPGSVSATSLTFTVTPEHADRCAWLVLTEDGTGAIEAADVFERGTLVAAAAAGEYTASGLDPQTSYAVFAAVGSEAGTAVNRITMTTAAPASLPVVGIEIGKPTDTSVTFSLTPSGADRCWYMVVASDGRVPDAAMLEKEGSEADAAVPDRYTVGDLKPASTYSVYAVAAAQDRFGEVVSAEFTTEKEQPNLPGLTADVSGKEFTYVERSNYFGDAWSGNSGWFVYALRDSKPDANGEFPAGTATLCFELFADLAASEGGVLPAGNYTVGTGTASGTCRPGEIIGGFDEGSYSPDVTYYTCNGEFGIVNGGTLAVETTTDGYRLTFDFTAEDGHRVSATYAGTLRAPGTGPVDPSATTTLTDDYRIRFAEGEGTKVDAYYYGYSADNLADLWSVYMEPVHKDGNSDGFMMDLLVDPALGFDGGFPAGTADVPDEYGISYYGEPGHYLPGEFDADGVMIHTWYLGGYVRGPGDEWMVTRYAAAQMGFIYISRTDDRYTITVEYSDEDWHTVTGSWSGTVSVHDMTAAAPATVFRGVRPTR